MSTAVIALVSAVLGGSFREVVIDDAGHVPFIEKPDEFNAMFHAHLAARAP